MPKLKKINLRTGCLYSGQLAATSESKVLYAKAKFSETGISARSKVNFFYLSLRHKVAVFSLSLSLSLTLSMISRVLDRGREQLFLEFDQVRNDLVLALAARLQEEYPERQHGVLIAIAQHPGISG